jgi:rSAM/selenodomain-associated transferase 2
MISIIIPTLNEGATLESFLQNLLSRAGCFGIILADGGSTDGTLEILNRFPGVKFVQAGRGRGRQMNEGARQAPGDILLFLHADTNLPPNAIQLIEEAMSDSSIIGGCFTLKFDRQNAFFTVLSFFSQINHTLFTYGDQGLFLRASTFKKIGGFRDIPVMEDVEIQGRLRKLGKFIKIGNPVVTSARRYNQNGPLRQHLVTTWIVLLFHLGISPRILHQYYRYGQHGSEGPGKGREK